MATPVVGVFVAALAQLVSLTVIVAAMLASEARRRAA
jgi:hypothetical protein